MERGVGEYVKRGVGGIEGGGAVHVLEQIGWRVDPHLKYITRNEMREWVRLGGMDVPCTGSYGFRPCGDGTLTRRAHEFASRCGY